MKKKYLYTFLFVLVFLNTVVAQENKDNNPKTIEQPLDNLNIYPNPAGGDKVYITAKSAGVKDIEIFDVLGKRVLQTVITNRELNITTLTPGVYIIQIKEAEQRVMRKLIIK